MGESESARTERRVPWVGSNFVELPHLCICAAVALRIPQWEKEGWSRRPPRADIKFPCPRSSSGIEADGAVCCDILAAFVKQIREQQRGYSNAKLQINLSLLHSECPVINGGSEPNK